MGSYSNLQHGEQIRFDYIGTYEEITLLPGSYQLECYGAGGSGYGYINPQGYGGYVKGVLNTYDELKMYVYAGQCGIDFYQYFMRFNGGGLLPMFLGIPAALAVVVQTYV